MPIHMVCRFRSSGHLNVVDIRRTIRRRFRDERDGISVDADVNAQIAVNVGGGGTTTAASAQRTTISQSSRTHSEENAR